MNVENELEIMNLKSEKIQELSDIQNSDGNWNYDEYMRGMANGLILAVAVLTDKTPIYKEEQK